MATLDASDGSTGCSDSGSTVPRIWQGLTLGAAHTNSPTVLESAAPYAKQNMFSVQHFGKEIQICKTAEV